MTKEDKKLLLKDICARLPYGVICCVTHKKNGSLVKEDMKLSGIFEDGNFYFLDKTGSTYSDNYIPYLRQISSMTEKEKKELLRIVTGRKAAKYFQVLSDGSIDNTDARHQDLDKFSIHYVDFNGINTSSYLDWLNAHHFDYRGLIKKGLAIEATTNMYNN